MKDLLLLPYCFTKWKVTAKFFLVLIFLYCAISFTTLPTTQAIPVRRTSTSGQRLILHTNSYRERYQVPEHRQQHKKHHLQQRQQLLETRQPKSYTQQQRKTSYIAPILRRAQQHYRKHQQQLLQHRHHLNLRAAPAPNFNITKMCACENSKYFKNLSVQLNASLQHIWSMAVKYLREREGVSYQEMWENWHLVRLEAHNPNHQAVTYGNQLHHKLYNFYMRIMNSYHLAEMANREAKDQRRELQHQNVNVSSILTIMNQLKAESIYILNETETVLQNLNLSRPNIAESDVTYNTQVQGHVRDFLIIKEFLEEIQDLQNYLNYMCQMESHPEA